MATYEQQVSGDVDAFVSHLDRAIPSSSATAKLEDTCDQRLGDARMVVRVYERYSALGGNRVSHELALVLRGELAELDPLLELV